MEDGVSAQCFFKPDKRRAIRREMKWVAMCKGQTGETASIVIIKNIQ